MTLLDSILRSPQAPQWAAKLQQTLAEEARRRDEFRDWLTEDVKAEFINGERIVHSPARNDHNQAGFRLAQLLAAWTSKRGLGQVGMEKNLIGLTRNDYEPDLCWWGPAKSSLFQPDTMVFPAPDLVVEVLSPTTEANDRGVKFEDYAAHGIEEYWIIDAREATVEQYQLVGGIYTLKMKSADGTLRSSAVGGIEFPVTAIFDAAAHKALIESVWTKL